MWKGPAKSIRRARLRGEIALCQEKLDEAKAALEQMREFLAGGDNHIDIALVSLRLSKVLLLSGRVNEMLTLAGEMVQLLVPLREESKIASGILSDFIQGALAGKVTADFLDRASTLYREAAKEKSALLRT